METMLLHDTETTENAGVYFFSTERRISYELYLGELITYEPPPMTILHFPINEDVSLKIRGLCFTRRGILKDSRVLGVFTELKGSDVYIVADENAARRVSKKEFFDTVKKFNGKACEKR